MFKALPQDAKIQAVAIYGNMKLQMADPIDTAIRDAVIPAYGVVQRERWSSQVVLSCP